MKSAPASQSSPAPNAKHLAILREYERRVEGQESLAAFARLCEFEPARHHIRLIEKLEAVARGELKRLAIFAPPGSAKSTYTSILFPAWLLAQTSWHARPWDIIAASHTATLAEEFSRRVRARMREYGPMVLGVELSDDSQSVERWQTTRGDIYRAVGAGAAVTGQRADVILLDDPIKSREQADSETARAKVWSWYLDDLRTRMKPEAAIVLIQTRWHEDDVGGRILPESWDGESGKVEARDGEIWEVVCLPAICDREDDPLGRAIGEPLWPEWQSLAVLEQERRTLSARSWSALFQQRPSPDDGDFFKAEWLGRYTAIPPGSRHFLASDWATPEGTDWTVHVCIAVDASNRLYVADVWRGRGTTAESIDAALDMTARYKPAAWLNEKGVLWRTITGQAQARMRERNVFVPCEEYARTQDKPTMARAIQGRWSQGMVMLPEQAPWLAALEHEMLRFPAGRNDDQVDALALIGLHLDKVVAPPKTAMRTVVEAPRSTFGGRR
jgi:predicted phage terminase large subunit-like protein